MCRVCIRNQNYCTEFKTSPYILIAQHPQKNNERNNFINVVQDACTNECDFSAGLDATKLVKGVHLSEQNQAAVVGAYPDHFFPASESSVGEVEYKPTYIKLEKNSQSLHLKSKLLFSIYNMFERVCCLIF